MSGIRGRFRRDRTASVSVEWTCVFVRSAARIDPRVLDEHSELKHEPPTRLGREIDYTHAFDVHVNDLLRTHTVSNKACVVGDGMQRCCWTGMRCGEFGTRHRI